MRWRKNVMDRPRVLACVALLTLPTASVAFQAQNPGEVAARLGTGIGAAVIAGDDEGLTEMVALARRAVTAFPEDGLVQHYLGYALYRLATLRFDADPDGALAILFESESSLLRSVELEPIPESHALMSSVLGRQIVSDETAMSLSMRSGAEMRRAVQMGPRNPRVKVLEGISAFHTPSMYGGGYDIALDRFLAAVALFEEDAPESPLPAWGRAEVYAWLGQTYVALRMPEEARAAYERALEIEPSYAWVRDTLLPALSP
ncbi:MAG: tetratricopeptide repeat protein [Gemmatimonadales bacterium]|nr:tetratricopeptide repeat protein [Gemmatimonadales bacterium]MYG20137.1 tetratricopeptide repeat protein [Gemmatimonadales bacterium]